eukprot:s6615_g1.t1
MSGHIAMTGNFLFLGADGIPLGDPMSMVVPARGVHPGMPCLEGHKASALPATSILQTPAVHGCFHGYVHGYGLPDDISPSGQTFPSFP